MIADVRTNMKRIIPYLITALLFLVIGYFLGGYRGTRQAAFGSNAGSLVWFTGIHQRIAKGDYEKAKELTESAVDAHVGVLAQIQSNPESILVWIIPWAPDVVNQISPGILKNANDYFVEKTSALKPETREYLASTQHKEK